MDTSNWIVPIISFITIIFVIYLIGMSIVKLIDNKIGDIEIKMPRINVNTKLNVTKDANGLINITPEDDKKLTIINDNCVDNIGIFKNDSDLKENFLTTSHSFDEYGDHDVIIDREFNMVNLPNNTEEQCASTKIGCSVDADCNVVNGGDASNGNGKNICRKDGTCHCVSGSGKFCQYGPTNYKDPNSMTTEERKIFKYQFRNNFTLQDYKNWLMLYKNDSQHLRENHRDNLAKLLRGQPLYFQDMPNIRIKPPMEPADYFGKMYEGGKISVHFPEESETGAMLGYNYSQYSEFISPEKAAKTWITGIEDLYKRPNKDSARELNYYLRPEATVGVERQLVGREYLNWVKKHHNLADIRKLQIRQDESINTFQSADVDVIAPL